MPKSHDPSEYLATSIPPRLEQGKEEERERRGGGWMQERVRHLYEERIITITRMQQRHTHI